MAKPTAFIVGFTGEVGKQVTQLAQASDDIAKVILIGRREIPEFKEKQNVEQRVINFDEVESNSAAFQGADIGYCCLGTTRGKSGKDGFYKVDHDYVVGVAKAAKTAGCKQFHLVSSSGAKAGSWNFYLDTKGKAEEEIKNIGFDYFSIYRPAFLLCEREESRFGEKLATFAMKPIIALRPTWISVPTVDVAKAMLQNSVRTKEPKLLLENAAIHELAAAYSKSSE